MSRLARLLIVEDSEDDAKLALRTLHRGGFAVVGQRVETLAELRAALGSAPWDAVISDYSLPAFAGMEALEAVRATGLDLPFVLVSGAIGEETAASAMKAGADDCVMKANLARLAPALERALKEAAMRAAHRKAQEDLVASEKRYRLLFHGSTLPLWVYDIETLRFLDVNDVACLTYGYSREEFLGLTLRDIRPAEDVAALERETAADRPPRSGARIRRHRLRNGSLIDVEVRSHNIAYLGRAARFVSVIDVSERVRAEAEVRRLNADLEHRVAERTRSLQVANRELEAFAHSISHDLRAPLVAIRKFGDALWESAGGLLDANARHYLKRIRDGAARMERMVGDLLALSRVGHADFTPGEVDMSALAREVLAEIREADPQRRCELSVMPGMRARGDASLLRIALTNLLANAWKFSSRKDVAVIEVGQLPEGSANVTYFVKDRGAGFDPADGGRLFESFSRLHSASEFPGTGLGLAIVRRVIDRHGGRVRGEGIPGEGATFWFSLPADAAGGGETCPPSRC